MENSPKEKIFPTYDIALEGDLRILTIHYKDPGIRDCAFSIYWLKTKKSFKVYYPRYRKNIKPLKIFRKKESVNEFCLKKLEGILKAHIGKKV